MSKTASPWGNATKLSILKQNLSTETKSFETTVPESTNNDHINKPYYSTTIFPSPTNVKNNTEFRKWNARYSTNLEQLYKIFLNGLKSMNIFTIKEIETKFSINDFNFLLYQKTSKFLRNAKK